MDVALTNKTQMEVTCSFKDNPLSAVAERDGYVNVPVQDLEKGLVLEPAKCYMFRVAAVNELGIGPWSEVSAFRTLTPGLPGAPNNVKINKSENGATVSWDAPANSYGTIHEYALFLAVNVTNANPNNGNGATVPSFQRVYVGFSNQCLVTSAQLQNARIDVSGAGGKPAIIFRIAARNANGFGPSTQIRWLQTS